MSVDLIQYAFTSGEISPQLFGRTDLEKYDLGLAEAHNFFVDYRGGISTRPGTIFVDFVWKDANPVRLFPFNFAPNVANTYILVFGGLYVRFIQAGGYVLEEPETITNVTKANPAKVASAGHGYSTGDWVQISGVVGMTDVNARTFEIVVTDPNTFELHHPHDPTLGVDSTGFDPYVSGGQANRIYTVTTPYAAADLPDLKVYQIRDLLRITHPSYAPRNLIRKGHKNWVLEEEDFGTEAPTPTKPVITPSAAGNAGAVWVATSVSVGGDESLPSDRGLMLDSVNYTIENGSAVVRVDVQPEVKFYNFYRSRITIKGDVTQSMEVGFVGQAFGPVFTDSNVLPDFTVTPPQHFNPFANETIEQINIDNQGSGYPAGATVSITSATGSGFQGFPVVERGTAGSGGPVLAIVVINGGEGYKDTDTVVVSGGGTGFAATLVVGEATGNYPAVSATFQQRQLYAATPNQPLTVWGSRPGRFSNFDFSRIVLDNDSYEFTLDSEEAAPIEHLIPTRQGLLVMSMSGVWLLHGGDELAVTPTNAALSSQTSFGASRVAPLEIESDIIYIEGKGLTVRLLEYSELRKAFGGRNMSVLSNHLFSPGREIKKWAYAGDPHRIIWAVREDGILLAFTLDKELEVFGWTPCETNGRVLDVEVVREDDIDVTYLLVERHIHGRWNKVIERFALRNFRHVEDSWCVDMGTELVRLVQQEEVFPGKFTGDDVAFRTDNSFWTSADVGKVILGNGGKAKITTFVSDTIVKADIIRDFDYLEEDAGKRALELLPGKWMLRRPVTEVDRLWHLEGEKVAVLADGNVQTQRTVVGGKITLDQEAVLVTVGLPFVARAKTLPQTVTDVVIENRRKDIISLAVRMHDTRGLKVGAHLDALYEMRERTTEAYGEPTAMQQGYKTVLVASDWDDNGQAYMVQDQPLPATVLGIVKEVDVGDDRD